MFLYVFNINLIIFNIFNRKTGILHNNYINTTTNKISNNKQKNLQQKLEKFSTKKVRIHISRVLY